MMEYTEAILNRLRRIEGQVRGVQGMMNSDKHCKDVVTQLSAIRSAVDKVLATIVVENLEECIRHDVEHHHDTRDTVEQAMALLMKSL